MLLIDEVDRADEALEAVLLETLAEFQVSVPEVGTFTTKTPPYVVLTSNNTRDLSAALKRRCLHLFLDYPVRGARAGDRPLARTPGCPTRWPRSWSRSCAGCASWSCASRRRSPRRSTGPARWPCSGWRSSPRRCCPTPRRSSSSTTRTCARRSARCPGWSTRTRWSPTHGHGHGHGHGHDDRAPRRDRGWRRTRRRGGRPRGPGGEGHARVGTAHALRQHPLGPADEDAAAAEAPAKVPAERGQRSFGAGLGRKRAL